MWRLRKQWAGVAHQESGAIILEAFRKILN